MFSLPWKRTQLTQEDVAAFNDDCDDTSDDDDMEGLAGG